MKRRHPVLSLSLLGAVILVAAGSAVAGYTGHYYEATNGYNSAGTPPGLPYWIYIPDGYDPAQSDPLPLFVYLHGSGNSGTDNTGPSTHPNASALRAVVSNPATPGFLIVPQTMNSWDYDSTASQALFELIDVELIGNQGLEIDTDRVYTTGFSLGGIGCFDWTGWEPSRFAAICPFAGSLYWNPETVQHATNRAQVATWAFSGANDGTVTPASTEATLSAQAYYGGDPLMTTYAAAGHNDTWQRVRDEETAIYWWMLAQRNGQPNDMSMFVGWETNTVETVILDGPAQSVVRTDPYFVGYYGTGHFHVLNGATMTNTIGYIASQKYGRGNVVVNGSGSQWINSGAVTVGHTNPGTLHVANGGEVIAADLMVRPLSWLTGNGTVSCDVDISGTVRPGDVPEVLTALLTPGTIGGRRPPAIPVSGEVLAEPVGGTGQAGSPTGVLTLGGNVTQFASGLLEVELGGTAAGEYDALEITGHANFVGNLAVTVLDGFEPQVDDVFIIVTASSRVGAFAQVDGLRIGGGRVLDVIYTPTTVELHTVAGIPGDVDGNGSVSLADFAVLKSNFGSTDATWEQGDFNGDGIVDLDDFVLLKKNFGG